MLHSPSASSLRLLEFISRGMDLSLVFIIKDVYLIVCAGLLVGKTYILDKHEKLIEDIYGKVTYPVILQPGLVN